MDYARRKGGHEHGRGREYLQPEGLYTVSRDLRESGRGDYDLNAIFKKEQINTGTNDKGKSERSETKILHSGPSEKISSESTGRNSEDGFFRGLQDIGEAECNNRLKSTRILKMEIWLTYSQKSSILILVDKESHAVGDLSGGLAPANESEINAVQ